MIEGTLPLNTKQLLNEHHIHSIGVGFIPAGYKIPTNLITCFSLEPRLYRIHSILYRKDLIMSPPHRYLIKLAREYVNTNWNNLPELKG